MHSVSWFLGKSENDIVAKWATLMLANQFDSSLNFICTSVFVVVMEDWILFFIAGKFIYSKVNIIIHKSSSIYLTGTSAILDEMSEVKFWSL